MDPNHEIEHFGETADEFEIDETASVDDFIKELEAKEKDLHITADTSIIEIAEDFDGDLQEFLRTEMGVAMNGSGAGSDDVGGEPDEADEDLSERLEELSSVVSALEQKNAELKQKIAKLEAEQVESFRDTQRRAKDFENFKARTARERTETFQSQVGDLATQMLPALDNLHRAIDFADNMSEEERNSFKPFFDGIVLVNRQVNDVLAGMGIQEISTVGEDFDPHFHEAVAAVESEDYPPNTITAEMLRGYRIGDRVIRPSMVAVSTGSPGAIDEIGSASADIEVDDENNELSDNAAASEPEEYVDDSDNNEPGPEIPDSSIEIERFGGTD